MSRELYEELYEELITAAKFAKNNLKESRNKFSSLTLLLTQIEFTQVEILHNTTSCWLFFQVFFIVLFIPLSSHSAVLQFSIFLFSNCSLFRRWYRNIDWYKAHLLHPSQLQNWASDSGQHDEREEGNCHKISLSSLVSGNI